MENSADIMEESVRERLLVAGIREIEEHGFNDFSLRRVAAACELSCAAPYRHFKSKEELLREILSYLSSRRDMLMTEALAASEGDLRAQLIDVSVQYIRFLIVTPSYLSILFHEASLSGGGSDRFAVMRDDGLYEAASAFADSVGMSAEKKEMLIFSLRAMLYGTVVLIRAGDQNEIEGAISNFRRKLEAELNA